MSEKEVLFEDNMETQAQDFINMQEYIGDSIDHIVTDAIDSGNAYTGLTVTKAAATQVSIGVGRLYWGGAVYVLEDPVTIDFQSIAGAMPVTQFRQIAIVAWGSTINSDVEPRNFVVDADTGQAQPESVSMEQIRLCNIGSVSGTEAPSPNYPPVQPTNLLVGYVLLNPAGVVSIQQSTTTQLANLTSVEGQMQSLSAVVSQEQTQIATLQTALASLAAQFANYVSLDKFNKLSDLVNWCYQKLLQPPSFVLNTIDNFFDTSQSAVGTNVDGAYSAYIASGLRFGSGASWTGKLALNNPTEPLVQAWDTYILPKPSGSRIRMDCSFPSLDWTLEALLNHPYWTFAPRRLNWARYRYRCGPPYLPTAQSIILASVATCDPLVSFLMFDLEAWVPIYNNAVILHTEFNCDFPRWDAYRYKYYWNDWVDVDYWSKVYTNYSYSHNHMAQSFLNSQDGWLSGITLFSMQPSYFQPLSLHISACDDQGVPDHTQTLGKIDLDANSIQPCYQTPLLGGDVLPVWLLQPIWGPNGGPGGMTYAVYYASLYGWQYVYQVWGFPIYVYPLRLTFSPVFLKAGQRYAFHVHSTYAHQFACSTDRSCYQVHGGDFWDYDGSSWFRVAASPRSLKFQLWYLTWGNWGNQPNPGGQLRYDIQLQTLQLAGGIANIDVLAEHIVPAATDLNYAVQVGGSWQPFDADPNSPSFTGNPALLPFKVTFTGTSDLMPGVSLTNSQLKLTGPAMSSYHHISTNIPCTATGSNGVKVQAQAMSFVSGHHTLNCHIRTSGGQLTPAPVSQATNPDGTTQLTWTFSVAGITGYQIELDGGTDGTGDNFVVSQRASFSA